MSGPRLDLSAREWGRLAAMLVIILAINALGWGIYVLDVMPHHFNYQGEGGSRGLGVGLGVAMTAWFLGFRHAFDADHISCVMHATLPFPITSSKTAACPWKRGGCSATCCRSRITGPSSSATSASGEDADATRRAV